ncbi:MAG TPA: apolipoprotein N-acyltransferase, partial [Candidatus Tyrphobacter sp.]
MSAVTKTAKPSLRMMLSSLRARDVMLAAIAGAALSLAFPKIGAAWLVPFGTAALFWTWQGASWRRAFGLGWLAGTIFFSISFAWWTYTIGHEVGPFWAGVAVFVCAAVDALTWGAAGALAVVARRRSLLALAPLAGAAVFAIGEWLRSIGPVGIPFAQLGYTQAETPLRVFAAYIGTFGVTFVLCAIGAYTADALRRRTLRPLGVALGSIAAAWLVCWLLWPARHAAPATIPVAAVQGNIVQSLKWQPGSLELAVRRYIAMTRAAAAADPRLVVWPETVITVRGVGLNLDPELERRFAMLAHDVDATLVVGSIAEHDGAYYNSLFFFTPGRAPAVYDKRQLVPFAEDFPLAKYLYWIPYVGTLNGGFSAGSVDGVYPTAAGLLAAPLICWESAFADRVHAQVARGAQVLIVSTDDAWFGETSGPYQHAQISQLRAVENGVWLVRAAATGVSGIIAPDGRWTARAPMDTQTSVAGDIGPPTGSLFARIGPLPVIALFALLYLAIVLRPLVLSEARS